MARWRDAHDALARERYPHLVSFAALLTGDDAAARALVDEALVAELSRIRGRVRSSEVEEAVRARVAREFVRRDGERAPGVRSREHRMEVPAPVAEPEPHPSAFAPPGPRALEPVSGDPEQAPAQEPPPRTQPVAIGESLASLPALERAIVLLHHVERLSPASIARTLGHDAEEVRTRLAAADLEMGRETGLTTRPAAYAEGDHIEIAVTVSPAGRT
ncbi:RNA polymerase sigma factor [Demequina activiva]|uniref:RNA polymerase sigma factor 70 region 4 type 2 domain-containing protein n=1 Tax=Demequina activiva TaxID=1582364 RepID=A0A919Q233_9MICO|nr:sigma factor-like helix-turn-helix DNA-binding protein [Demequina activiva]GIG53837.1 hypothetical protein Dac01nite_05890 [Demequina activiva]